MSVERQRDLVNSFDTRRRSPLTPATVKALWMMVVTMTITDPKMIWRVKWVLLRRRRSWKPSSAAVHPISGHSLLPRGSASPDYRQSFRTAPEFEVGALYGLTIEVHVKRLSRLDREG